MQGVSLPTVAFLHGNANLMSQLLRLFHAKWNSVWKSRDWIYPVTRGWDGIRHSSEPTFSSKVNVRVGDLYVFDLVPVSAMWRPLQLISSGEFGPLLNYYRIWWWQKVLLIPIGSGHDFVALYFIFIEKNLKILYAFTWTSSHVLIILNSFFWFGLSWSNRFWSYKEKKETLCTLICIVVSQRTNTVVLFRYLICFERRKKKEAVEAVVREYQQELTKELDAI